MQPKTIYLDLDDVLCETARGCLAVVEREFGKRIPYDCLTSFDLGYACGLTADERSALYDMIHNPDELLTLEPIPESIPIIKRWTSEGHRVAIVTGRPPAAYEPSLEWLRGHGVPYHSFTMVDKYGRFETENTVAITLSELAGLQFDVAVEDSATMASFLVDQMKLPVKLFDRPWNRISPNHPNIRRFSNWREIAGLSASNR